MVDRLKTVRIRARNVHRILRHKRLDDDASLAYLSRSGKVTMLCSRCAGVRRLVETQKKLVLAQRTCLVVASEQETYRDSKYALSTLTPNLSNLTVINSVLGKNLEHPRLTR